MIGFFFFLKPEEMPMAQLQSKEDQNALEGAGQVEVHDEHHTALMELTTAQSMSLCIASLRIGLRVAVSFLSHS